MKNFDENDVGANAKIIAGTSVNVDYSILNSSDTELSNAKISKTETLSEAKDSYMLIGSDQCLSLTSLSHGQNYLTLLSPLGHEPSHLLAV